MAVKWIWGFESGADKSFYSGSGWDKSFYHTYPFTGDSDEWDHLFSQDTESLYDYSNNFPHQPPSVVGGGQYSLRVDSPPVVNANDSFPALRDRKILASYEPLNICSPSLVSGFYVSPTDGSSSIPAHTLNENTILNDVLISLSIYSNFDQSLLPVEPAGNITFPSGSAFYAQRFLSLYPDLTGETSPNVPSFKVADSQMLSLPPQVQLYLFSTASAGVMEHKILALCSTYNSINVETNTSFDTNMVYVGEVNSEAPWAEDNIPDAINGVSTLHFAYTSSAGVYLTPDEWHKITVHWSGSTGAGGAFGLWLDGSKVIDETGPTGYNSPSDTNRPSTFDSSPQIGRIQFGASPIWCHPSPWWSGNTSPNSSSLQPGSFWFDHVVVFDDPVADLAAATSSIFIDRFIPDQDISTGSYVGNDSGTTDLFDYIDDTASTPECLFSLTGIYETKAGHASWSVGNISEIIGLSSINLVSSSVELGLYGASTLKAAGLGGEQIILGAPSDVISGTQFVQLTRGTTFDGVSWNYLTGTSGPNPPGSQISHAGFYFNNILDTLFLDLNAGATDVEFDSFSNELSMYVKESGSGDIMLTWVNGTSINPGAAGTSVYWQESMFGASKPWVVGATYYLDVRENFGDNFFTLTGPTGTLAVDFSTDFGPGLSDPMPSNVGDLFENGYPGAEEAARFYFIYNGTGSALTNPTPGTCGERYFV